MAVVRVQVSLDIGAVPRKRESEGNNGNVPRSRVSPKPETVHRQAVPLEEETFIGISSEGGGGGGNHCPRLDIMMMDCPGGSTTTRATAGLSEDEQEDLVKVVRSLLAKEDQQTKDDQIRREWRMLAETVDRWLFWSFFFITTLSTLLFLVILPYSHRGKFF